MKNVSCFIFATGFCMVAHAQAPEPWLLPDPSALMEASNVLCIDQVKSTLVAGALRAEGRSKEEVLALLPESPKGMLLRVVGAMRESVEDAFDFPEFSIHTQFAYRSEACFRETLSGVRVPRLAAIRPQVEKCQQVHGTEKSNALFKCVETVVRSAEPRL
jgi:hypothetical protein